ncbi:MAG: Acyl CoA:acetate/3-ketoacid CoA transferase, alpha subunit [Syntrophus sp. SKADARSKE-3]|nr:Acyl CoA:acetate/3-ketoacid CoA transferase, alpha subunit [Syntrophus sp. SKADARSKE-3]
MEVIDQGIGKIFTDPDPDKARAFFRKKSRKLESKLMSVKEAVEKYVYDGDYLVLGGFGANRIPAAVAHEILRQGRKNMGFAGHTSTHDFQILCAGEVFSKCDAAYIVGLEARGLSPNARRYMESGKVEVSEWTNYSLSVRFKAAAAGVSYYPSRNIMGTDTFKFSGGKIIECPFTGKKFFANPAIYPDVSAIHVHEADIYGNCRVKGITVSDFDVARATKRLIITCERLVTEEEIRRDPSSTVIPYWLVDAVCPVPYGSYPGNMYGEYFSDEEHLREWMKVEEDPEAFKKFLDKNIYSCKDHFDYIEKNGGMHKLLKLREKEFMFLKARD